MLNRSERRQIQRLGPVGPTRDAPYRIFVNEQPRFRHPDRHDGERWHFRPDARYAGADLFVAEPWVLPLRVAVHYDQLKTVVELQNGFQSLGHLKPGWRVQSPEVWSDNVKLNPLTLCDAGDVPSQRRVRGTVRQKERARRHASVREI